MRRGNQRLIQSPEPGQNDLKFRPRARRTVKIEPTAQTVRHDVVEDMQAKACTAEMAARRVEWIEGVTPDVGAHAATIVGKQNFDAVLSGCPDLDGHGTFVAIRKSVHDRIDEEDRKQLPARSGITVYRQIGLGLDVEPTVIFPEPVISSSRARRSVIADVAERKT